MLNFNNDAFKDAEEYRKNQNAEFERISQEPSPLPIPEDRVLLHAGLLGRGHNWDRLEGVCLQVAGESVKVSFDQHGKTHYVWVHPAIIVDNLGKATPPKKENNK